MANDFSFGGRQGVVVHRQLTADNQWIPTATASQYKDPAGATLPDAVLTEIAGVGANNGFYGMADLMVSVLFTGFTTATVCVQVYVPSYTGGAAWKTIIPTSKWTVDEAKVIQGPVLAWRAGCVTIGADAATLFVTAWYTPAKDR